MIKELTFRTLGKEDFVDVTEKVKRILENSNTDEGTVTLFVPHTTAAVTINENADPDVKSDMIRTLNRMVPEDWHYDHMEGNSPAHVKASLVGMSEIVPIQRGKMLLGTWQGIYFCEFDGPRTRKLYIKISD